MRFRFLFLMILWPCFSFGKTCEQIHAPAPTTILAKVFRQAQKLNPDRFHQEPVSVTDLYLQLKGEEWTYSPIPLREVPRLQPISTDLAEYLRAEYSKNFDLNGLSSVEFTQFYVNALRGLYARLVADVKLEKVKSSTAVSVAGMESFAAALADVIWFSKDLRDRELAPDMVRQWLQTGDEGFPWSQTLTLVRAWKAENKSSFFVRREFYTWLEQRGNSDLSEIQIEKVVAALEREDLNRKPICCATACFNCPNNRARLHQ